MLAVQRFHDASVRAGGLSSGFPSFCSDRFSATILDLDLIVVDAVFIPHSPSMLRGRDRTASEISDMSQKSSVLQWQKQVASSLASAGTVTADLETFQPSSPRVESSSPSSHALGSSKALVGTLLGAAGGAAVAYAMMRAEQLDKDMERSFGRPLQDEYAVQVDRSAHGMSTSNGKPDHGNNHGSDISRLVTTLVPVARNTVQLLEAPSLTRPIQRPSRSTSGTLTPHSQIPSPLPPVPPSRSSTLTIKPTYQRSLLSALTSGPTLSTLASTNRESRVTPAQTIGPSDSISQVSGEVKPSRSSAPASAHPTYASAHRSGDSRSLQSSKHSNAGASRRAVTTCQSKMGRSGSSISQRTRTRSP